MSESLLPGPSPIHGTGVFADHPFRRGDHLGTYDGRPAAGDGTHVLWIEDGSDHGGWRLIEGTGVLRWLNHSRSPNCEFDGPELYACRDIEAGEELTFDYGEDWADVD